MARNGRYAAIDIGTVTCRLLVADVTDAGLREVERRCAITNLGIGVDSSGSLRHDAIGRVVEQVAEYAAVVTALGEGIPVSAVATSAARDADNAGELVKALRDRADIALRVIPGEAEAALSFQGASCGFEGETLMVADIGGGSTEIVAGLGGQAPQFAHSFNIGCRRMTERFLAGDPPTHAECDTLRAFVREAFAPYFKQVSDALGNPARLVAVAGTATSVVSIDQGMEVYDSARVHHTCVPRATLEAVYERLRALPVDKRREVVGLEPARAGVIVAGTAILLETLAAAGLDSFTVSESDILHGLIMDAAR